MDDSILLAWVCKSVLTEVGIVERGEVEDEEWSAICSKCRIRYSILLNWDLKEENSFFISIKELLILVISLVMILNVVRISFLKCEGGDMGWLWKLWIESSREEWELLWFLVTDAYDLELGLKSQKCCWKPVCHIGGGGGWRGGGHLFSLQSLIR